MEIALQIIFSLFDEKVGPFVRVFYPKNVAKYTRSTVSSVTIDLFTYSKKISDELAIMSFPQLKMKGLVKLLEWKDSTRRGGRREATLSVLFEEKDDSILYKYKDDIEANINEFLIGFLPLVQKNEVSEILRDKLKLFHGQMQKFLLKLASQEVQFVDNSKQFPTAQEEPIKGEFAFKTIIIGDPGVGKTSMILQFTDRAFRRSYIPTIGANITEKTIALNNTTFQMILWDLAGQSKFQKIRSLYYNGAQCVIIVFDLTKPETFDNIKNWYSDVKSNFSNFDEIQIVMCGNKCDLTEDIQISHEEALSLANELNIGYLETSARIGKNIDKIFDDMINGMISKGLIDL
ncbi:Rab family GTPase [Promethearchaeum syntrophicum]|uniref:Rab family GTPase n=1 Tax=Promethearchaeum syntrophicum TaxID=2594042 RepID=A0A5B9DBZ1_9ARCH|nr:Rab family GTPase [Candidatus Prometheoarchaeum syntrophicum]QEE16551.1 Ras family protein [Candidatus Prometheoarchaeum syntrophicum]